MFNFVRFIKDVEQTTAQLTAAVAVRDARKNVRKDTRNLQNSISAVEQSGELEVEAVAPYAAAQEFGFDDIPAYGFNPYLRPAAKTAAKAVPDSAKKAVRSALQRQGV